MAEIQPFPGILYDVAEAELPKVLAPPYDVIPPAYQDELYARDPRNIVRVVLNRTPGDDGYREAGETFRRWREEGLLAADPEPAVYLLEQAFPAEGRTLRRYGLLARFRAEDPDKRVVLPHEHTRAVAKEDRFKVLVATRANFSPIFMMFPDPESRFVSLVAEAIGQPAALRYTDDGGVGHRLWRVTDRATTSGFRTLLAARKAYIADGHHRYATALRYRDAHGPEGAWTLGYFTPMGAPGLLVLPYHRILAEGPTIGEARSKLSRHFDLAAATDVAGAAHAVAASTRPYAFALAQPGGGALVAESKSALEDLLPSDTPRSLRALDTYFLHRAVLGPLLGVPEPAVSYVHSLAEAEEAVARGACRLAVLLRGTPVQQIVDVAEASESMPAKSTFFHPKLPSGLVIHPLAG
ncbi:MAG: DUF1015 domain-containing protein [Solirubrobacterales bacterium]